jgi:hypothetical protein
MTDAQAPQMFQTTQIEQVNGPCDGAASSKRE